MATTERDETISEKEARAEEIVEKTEEINKKIQREKDRINSVGDFATVHCIDYEFTEVDADSPDEADGVEFVFRTPDGTVTVTKQADGEFEAFLDEHNAPSLFEIVGKEHTCVKTYDGWMLHNNADADEEDYTTGRVLGQQCVYPTTLARITNWSYSLGFVSTVASLLYYPYPLLQIILIIILFAIGSASQSKKEANSMTIPTSDD